MTTGGDGDNEPSGIAPTARVVLTVVVAKALLFATIYLSFQLLPPIFDQVKYLDTFHWPRDEAPNTWRMFTTWDTAHYLYLSEEGYRSAGGSAAFHPLWPLLIRSVTPVFGSSLLAALVLANLLSVAGLVLLHRLATVATDRGTADITLLFALAYPGALFYCLPYTESLFLVISVGVFWLIATDRLGLAALLSVLAAPTRAVGVFLAIPLAWRLVSDWRGGRRPWWHCAAAAAPLVGMVLTLGMMWVETGNAMAGIEAQGRFASQGAIAKFFAPVEFFRAFVDVWGVHGVLHSGIDRLFFVLMLGAIGLVIRLERRIGPWTLYSAAMILVPATTMSFMSFTRYPTVVFPIFIAMAAVAAPPNRRELRWFALASFMVIQLFLLIRHVNSIWAG
jgi:hypothetical protein